MNKKRYSYTSKIRKFAGGLIFWAIIIMLLYFLVPVVSSYEEMPFISDFLCLSSMTMLGIVVVLVLIDEFIDWYYYPFEE